MGAPAGLALLLVVPGWARSVEREVRVASTPVALSTPQAVADAAGTRVIFRVVGPSPSESPSSAPPPSTPAGTTGPVVAPTASELPVVVPTHWPAPGGPVVAGTGGGHPGLAVTSPIPSWLLPSAVGALVIGVVILVSGRSRRDRGAADRRRGRH